VAARRLSRYVCILVVRLVVCPTRCAFNDCVNCWGPAVYVSTRDHFVDWQYSERFLTCCVCAPSEHSYAQQARGR
jgi:hypothetical protein